MCFFRVADDAPLTLGNWGMLRSDLRPKPVYHAFDFWHRLAGNRLPVSITPDQQPADPVGRVGAVAAVNSRTVRVMGYNFVPYDPTGADGRSDPTPYDHQVTFRIVGLAPGTYSVTVSVVDGGHDGVARPPALLTTKARTLEMPLTLSGDGVVLMEVTRA
jgi:hypothetical protein